MRIGVPHASTVQRLIGVDAHGGLFAGDDTRVLGFPLVLWQCALQNPAWVAQRAIEATGGSHRPQHPLRLQPPHLLQYILQPKATFEKSVGGKGARTLKAPP
jgi:hypothetical protein